MKMVLTNHKIALRATADSEETAEAVEVASVVTTSTTDFHQWDEVKICKARGGTTMMVSLTMTLRKTRMGCLEVAAEETTRKDKISKISEEGGHVAVQRPHLSMIHLTVVLEELSGTTTLLLRE